jgi:CBS-domain-containing membrane protein
MTRKVVAVEERTDLKDIAALMQKHNIKRVPVVRDGKVVGIVSRANLLQGLLAREPQPTAATAADETLRVQVVAALGQQEWSAGVSNVVVENGVVHVWGNVASPSVREAVRVAAENVPGVQRVVNKVVVLPRDALMFG